MSAQIIREQRAGQRNIAYCDTLGYVFCAACYHEGTTRPCEPSEPVGACDRCGADLALSVETYEGMAEIEFTIAKIF